VFRPTVVTTAVLLGVAATGGCASRTTAAATSVAQHFYAALQDEDGAAACRVLAPSTRSQLEQSEGKPCPAAVLEEHVPRTGEPRGTAVFGRMAQVRYDGETAFLTRGDRGWLVLAVACGGRPPERESPYDCRVEGG
jgi:hypothetical protein